MKVLLNQWLWSAVVAALLGYSYVMLNRTLVSSYAIKLNQAAVVTPVLEVGKKYELVLVNKLNAKVGALDTEADGRRYLDANGVWLNHDWLKLNDEQREPNTLEFEVYRYTYQLAGEGKPLKISFSSFNAQMLSGEVVAVLYAL